MAPSDDFTLQTAQLPSPTPTVSDDAPQTSGTARASLVLGLVSLVFCGLMEVRELLLVSILGCVVTGFPTLILGFCALLSIRKSKGRLVGRAMAWTGVVIGLLHIVTLIGGIIQVRQIAHSMRSQLNLKVMGLAIYNYEEVSKDLPPAYIATKDGKPGLSWRVALLPYIEQEALYKEFHLDEPWDSPHNLTLLDKMPDIYRSPNDPKGTADTPYRVFVGKDVIFSTEPRDLKTRGKYRLQNITDDRNETILIVECATKVLWTKPDELECADDKPLPKLGYIHRDRFIALMADGSLRTFEKKNEAQIRMMIRANDTKKATVE